MPRRIIKSSFHLMNTNNWSPKASKTLSDLAKENKLVVVPIEEYQDLNAMASKSLQDHATEQVIVFIKE